MSRQKTVAEEQQPPKENVLHINGVSYVTFLLDTVDVKKIETLANLEDMPFHAFLRYHVIATGLDCLLSNTQDIGRKFVEHLEAKKEEGS